MNLTGGQKVTIITFIGLFFVLYLGCDTKSKEIQLLEKSRLVDVQYLNVDNEIKLALAGISTSDKDDLELMQIDLEETLEDDKKIEILEKISGKWYDLNNPILAAHYAEKIGEIANTEDAWSIAGSTAYIALVSAKDENKKKHAQQKAITSFEKAISIAPDNLDYKINHALTYVEMPPKENPMKGILMLLELDKSYPEAAAVQLQLGRLALQTNQTEKAKTRFEKVLELEPNHPDVHCYLSELYRIQVDKEKFEYHSALCIKK